MRTLPAGAEAALFQAFVETSADAFALLDASGSIQYVSPSATSIHGYTPEEHASASIFSLVHEDDVPAVAEAFSQVLACPGARGSIGCRIRHKDGGWRHVDVTYVNRLDESAAGIIANYRDVSRQRRAEEELRQSEARYKSLIHGALYGIYRTTLDGDVVDANPAFARMLGYEAPEELRTLDMRDVYVDPAERQSIIDESRAQSRDVISSVVHWKRRDGTPIVVRISGRMVDLEGSRGAGFEGIAEDITEKRAREEQVRQSQKMEAVGRLARGIAHDFNNVLAAVLGNADLIQLRLKKDDPMTADLMEIGSAAERGASLTRQLLAFSRPQHAGEPRLLDLHEVVRGFDTMLQRLSGDIQLRLHTAGESPGVRINPGHIEQMVMNLVLNAREAVGDGGIIDVYADRTEVGPANRTRYPDLEPGPYARVAVRDNGPGINPAIEAHLFEPFFSTKDPSSGAGLGLSIVYGIAKDAGGAVSFASTPGEGTLFEVLLPIA